jgi:hypothetical protein
LGGAAVQGQERHSALRKTAQPKLSKIRALEARGKAVTIVNPLAGAA